MTYQRLAYEDASTTTEMCADCHAVEAALHLPTQVAKKIVTAAAVAGSAPSILFADYPREIKKVTITVTDAATRLANALQLHLD
jgi:hypothetical protein